MTHRVHAGVQAVEATGRKPVGDRVATKAQVEQLPPCNHAVLPIRQLRNRPIPRTSLHSYGL